MSHYAPKDANQKQIEEALKKEGFSVLSLHSIGAGCPDLLVGAKGQNFLFEIKNPNVRKDNAVLNPKQQKFHSEWKGQVYTIKYAEDAIFMIKWYLSSSIFKAETE